MEVKIGVQHALRELLVESSQSADEVHDAVTAALEGKTKVLTLVDERGRQLMVPVEKVAYVEIGEPESRRVGFGPL